MELNMKGHQVVMFDGIQAESQRIIRTDRNGLEGRTSKLEET